MHRPVGGLSAFINKQDIADFIKRHAAFVVCLFPAVNRVVLCEKETGVRVCSRSGVWAPSFKRVVDSLCFERRLRPIGRYIS